MVRIILINDFWPARLLQTLLPIVDKDGGYTYSSVATANNNCTSGSIALWPNPSKGLINIGGLNIGETITITTVLGQMLEIRKAANTTEMFDLTTKAAGVYIIKITGSNGQIRNTIKVTKN